MSPHAIGSTNTRHNHSGSNPCHPLFGSQTVVVHQPARVRESCFREDCRNSLVRQFTFVALLDDFDGGVDQDVEAAHDVR